MHLTAYSKVGEERNMLKNLLSKEEQVVDNLENSPHNQITHIQYIIYINYSGGTPTRILNLKLFSHKTLLLCLCFPQYFFPLLFRFGKFYWCALKFNGCILYFLPVLLNSSRKFLSVIVLHFYDFHLVLFQTLYFFANVLLLKKKLMFIYCWQRERDRERDDRVRVGKEQRQGDIKSKADSRLWDVSTEPDIGLKLKNRGSWPEPKSDS